MPERAQLFVQPDKNFLRYVAGILGITGRLVCYPVNPGTVEIDQFPKRFGIAVLCVTNYVRGPVVQIALSDFFAAPDNVRQRRT